MFASHTGSIQVPDCRDGCNVLLPTKSVPSPGNVGMYVTLAYDWHPALYHVAVLTQGIMITYVVGFLHPISFHRGS